MVAVSQNVTSGRGAGKKTNVQASISITDFTALIKDLRKLDNEILREFKKNAKKIGSQMRDDIRLGIPLRPPLSGMRKRVIPGRVTWGTGKPARSALIKMENPPKFPKFGTVSIVKITMNSPMTIIADISGRSNSRTGKTRVTKPYPYSLSKSGTRTHRINGQGVSMIQKLDQKSSRASRFIYPAAEKSMPKVRDEMIQHVNSAIDTVERELRSHRGS